MYVGQALLRRGLFVFAISTILIVAASAQTNNYKLAGAGSTEVNGIYFHTGSTYGELSRPKYQKAGTGTAVYVYNAQYSVDLSYYWNIDNDLDDENDSYYYWNGAFDGTPTTFPVTGASPNNWSNTGAGFGIGTTPVSTQLAIVTPTFTNGSSFTPVKVTSGATNYVVGRFQLKGNTEGAVLQAATISLSGTRTGISAVKLWSSSDATFNSGSDVQLSSKTDATSITFNGFNTVVDHSTGTYYFITVDLSVGSTGNVTPTIPSQASFTFAGANNPASFTSAALSSGAVYLQNTTPTSSNNTVSTTEDNDKIFAGSDFPYTDADGDALTNIQITTLESSGTLYLDANSNGANDAEDITLNQIISAANISKLKLKPAANANGSPYATFGFKVGDASVYSASAYTMTINVTAVNDAPTSANNTVTTDEDVTKAYTSADFSFTDIDAGDALNKIQITTLESAGTLYLDANNNGANDAEDITLNQEITTANISKLKFLAAANANGNGYATFQFKVSDGTAYSSSSYTITINVTAVNDVPTLTSVSTLTGATEDTPLTITYAILAAAADESDVEGSTISFRVEAVSTGTLTKNSVAVTPGSTLLSTGESWVWTPAVNATGTLNAFTIKAWDGSVESNLAVQVQVSVNASNDPPTAGNNSVTINEDNDKTFASSEFNYSDPEVSTMSHIQIVAIPSVGTLYNDANTDGIIDGGETLTASATVTKAHIDANRLKFKPAADSSGTPYTSFTFKVNDGADYSTSSYTMTINVTAVNDAPTAADNTVSTSEDVDKIFAASEFNYSDTEGSVLSLVQIATAPSAGTLYSDANLNGVVDGGETLSTSVTVTKAAIDSGKLKFKPAADGNGSPYTTFTFKVNDGTEYSALSSTMTINVTPVSDVTFTNGALYTPPTAVSNTNNNSVGRFLLTGDIAGASLSALTVTFASPPSGVNGLKLWSSTDNSFESGSDTQISSTTLSGSTAAFTGFSSSISASGTYYFVTVDLGTASGTIEPKIAGTSDITISSGTLTGTITNAALSNGEAPLPVELVSFTVSSKRLNAELQWKTASEANNYGFEVERKPLPNPPLTGEGIKGWGRVGFIEGFGTSNAPKEYSFIDKSSAAGKYLYRLKQIDRDGKFTYSQEIEVETGVAAKVFELSQNFPNPFNPATTIEFSVPENGKTVLNIFDILGREVATLVNKEVQAGVIQHVEFDASHLSSGLYFARLQFSASGGKELVQMKRMMLVK